MRPPWRSFGKILCRFKMILVNGCFGNGLTFLASKKFFIIKRSMEVCLSFILTPKRLFERYMSGIDFWVAVQYLYCPRGPREIFCPKVDGILVFSEIIEAFSTNRDRMMGDDEERPLLAMWASEVIERFGLESWGCGKRH